MNVCEVCGKGAMHGQNIRNTHSVGWRFRAPRTKRTFQPNLQPVRALVSGTVSKLKVCTKCIKANKVVRAL